MVDEGARYRPAAICRLTDIRLRLRLRARRGMRQRSRRQPRLPPAAGPRQAIPALEEVVAACLSHAVAAAGPYRLQQAFLVEARASSLCRAVLPGEFRRVEVHSAEGPSPLMELPKAPADTWAWSWEAPSAVASTCGFRIARPAVEEMALGQHVVIQGQQPAVLRSHHRHRPGVFGRSRIRRQPARHCPTRLSRSVVARHSHLCDPSSVLPMLALEGAPAMPPTVPSPAKHRASALRPGTPGLGGGRAGGVWRRGQPPLLGR